MTEANPALGAPRVNLRAAAAAPPCSLECSVCEEFSGHPGCTFQKFIVSGAETGAIPVRSRHCVLPRRLLGRRVRSQTRCSRTHDGARNPRKDGPYSCPIHSSATVECVGPSSRPILEPQGLARSRRTRCGHRRPARRRLRLAVPAGGAAPLSGRDQVFGIGLGVTAYTFGLRHAFDADHIAAIDNTTRKLIADGPNRNRSGSGSRWAIRRWCWCWPCWSSRYPSGRAPCSTTTPRPGTRWGWQEPCLRVFL